MSVIETRRPVAFDLAGLSFGWVAYLAFSNRGQAAPNSWLLVETIGFGRVTALIGRWFDSPCRAAASVDPEQSSLRSSLE